MVPLLVWQLELVEKTESLSDASVDSIKGFRLKLSISFSGNALKPGCDGWETNEALFSGSSVLDTSGA